MLKSFIFDLDGTLLDSLEDLANAGNAALARAGYATHPAESYRHFVGSGLERLLRRALPAGEPERLGDAGVRVLVEHARLVYGESWHVKSRPYAGVRQMLSALADKGATLGVLSNKAHPWTVAIVEHFFSGIPFALVRGAMPQVPLKPDPTAVLEMLAQLGIAGEECAYVGDSDVDMLTAQRAGLVSVGVAWGFRGAEEVRAAGACHIAATPEDIVRLA